MVKSDWPQIVRHVSLLEKRTRYIVDGLDRSLRYSIPPCAERSHLFIAASLEKHVSTQVSTLRHCWLTVVFVIEYLYYSKKMADISRVGKP